MTSRLLLACALICAGCREAGPPPPAASALQRLGLETAPLLRLDLPAEPTAKVDARLKNDVFPSTRKDEPLRLCLDATTQADLVALGAALDAQAIPRKGRAELVWSVLAGVAEARRPLLDWLGEQGVDELVTFQSYGRVCFLGSERIALAAAEREDVARVLPVPPVPAELPPTFELERETATPADHWALEALGVARLHEAGHRGAGVVVAVLDSGVDGEHPALAGRGVGVFEHRRPRGRDLAHGRQVLAAAVGRGLGVAPEASWAAADPIPEDARDPELFLRCIDWLLGEVRPDVVVAPWDMPPGTRWTEDLALSFGALRTAGAAVVFPAGNTGSASGYNSPPANLPALAPDGAPAFSVAGIDRHEEAYVLSNRGPSSVDGSPFPQVAAPAVRLAVLDPIGRQEAVIGEGTSFSAGYAGGVLAVLLAARPELTGPEAEALLRRTARDLGPEGHDAVFGHGLLDAAAALGLSPGASD